MRFLFCFFFIWSLSSGGTASTFAATEPSLIVKHTVKGNNVFVECIVDSWSFAKGKEVKREGEGRLALYINGKKVQEVSTAAFVIRHLPAGTHRIRLELIHNDSTPYRISREFDVTISS